MISNHLLNERNKLCKLPNKILNDKNFHLSIINNLAKDNYEKYFFMGPVQCYTKFKISPSEVEYSEKENEFRVACLTEELDELIDAHNEQNRHEVIDAIVDLLFFAIGTSYRQNKLFDTIICYSSFNDQNKTRLLMNESNLIIEEFFDLAREYIEGVKSMNYVSLLNLISLCITYLKEEYNEDIIYYYDRVTDANLSKELGSLPKRGDFSLDLVKPEGWQVPSFEGLLL